jgi:bifunctional oligoribonuclease and PAP phosphatase NrnA
MAGVLLPVLGEPSDAATARQIKALTGAARRIVITGHERPDGDCIGSEVALASILRAAGKHVEIVNADQVTERYEFLVRGQPLRQHQPHKRLRADLIFVLDATDLNRLGSIRPEHLGKATLVNLDHHLNNPHFGAVNLVDTRAAATAELVWRVAACCRWRVPQDALLALYTALLTDTGQFAYSNTTPRTMQMAAILLAHGIHAESVWRRVYLNKSWSELALEARARATLECAAGGKIASISLRHSDFAATGTGPQHAEEFPGIPRSLAGVQLALFFYEINGGHRTKVSLRSTLAVDACALAQKFGGGGHKQAAGCTLEGTLDAAKRRFLAEAKKAVGGAPRC